MPMQISISNAIGGGGGAQGSGGGSSFASTNSFTFDGNLDFVTMGDVLQTSNTGADPFSMSIWYKTTKAYTTMIMTRWYNSSPYGGYSMHMTGNNMLTFFIGSFQGSAYILVRSNVLPVHSDGNWHHLVATYDGSRTASGVNMYFDGSPLTINVNRDVAPNYINTNTTEFMIGARGTTSNYGFEFNGNLDEASYFDSVLDQDDVTSIYNSGVPNDISGLNPVGWWRMGEDATYAGGQWTLTDQGSGGNNGTSATIPSPPKQPSTDVPT